MLYFKKIDISKPIKLEYVVETLNESSPASDKMDKKFEEALEAVFDRCEQRMNAFEQRMNANLDRINSVIDRMNQKRFPTHHYHHEKGASPIFTEQRRPDGSIFPWFSGG